MSDSGERDDRSGLPDPEAVPDAVLERARKAFAQRAEGRIAHLVTDSLVDRGDSAESHVLAFESGAVTVQVRVAASETHSVLRGDLVGMKAARGMLHLEGSELAMVTDVEDGSFGFEPIARGVVRLSFEGSDGSALMTDWFQV